MKLMPAQTASRFNWIIPAIALAGFVVRVAGLDAQSLFNEEGYSLWLSQLGPARVLAQTASLDSNTPLHYLLLGGWVSLAGASEFSARLLSVFAGVLTIAVAAALAREVAAGAQRGLTGLGCYQFELPHAGDAWMEVACFWRLAPGAGLPWDTQVSLRLIDAAGAQVLQSDQMLAPYGLPYLAFDKPITAFYVLGSTDALAPGDYTLAAIPYTPEGQIAPQVITPIRIEARRSANAAP